jgi:hypothetical protein
VKHSGCRIGGSGWASQRLSVQSPLRGSMGDPTATQGSLGRLRSRHGSGPVPAVGDPSDGNGELRPIQRGGRHETLIPGHDCAPENTGRRAHSMVEERACTWTGQMLGKPGPPKGHVHTVRPQQPDSGTGAAGTGKKLNMPRQQERTLPHRKARAAGLNAPPDHGSGARDPTFPLIPSRRGGETLSPGDGSAPRSMGWRTHHRKKEMWLPP